MWFSLASHSVQQEKRRGRSNDDRFLWLEMLRAIREIQPTWIIGENVAGIQDMALTEILSDLENESYKSQTFLIPAYGLGGIHRRERIWIIANTNSGDAQNRHPKHRISQKKVPAKFSANANGYVNLSGGGNCRTNPEFVELMLGFPKKWTDLKSLGNAIVPQVVYQIFKAIEECELKETDTCKTK